MDVEKLTMDLRPRPHWQALDLGFALLRSRAASVYASWWAVWSGIVALACLGAALQPRWMWFWILVPWWTRPALERLVVHILSRGVFGETVTWKQAVRAWPSTWGGGMVRALTWWRVWALGRSFLQPTWQLEGVRGDVASHRREVLSRKGAGKTAIYWGMVCVHMEFVLWVALLAFVGLFVPEGQEGNPFQFALLAMGSGSDSIHAVAGTLAYGLVLGFVGPFYAACGFTLYLNRRAELEAWDIELALRRLARRKSSSPSISRIPSVVFAILALAGTVRAREDSCEPPAYWRDPAHLRPATSDPKRAALRHQVDSIFNGEPILKQWTCKETWVRKDTTTFKSEESAVSKEIIEALRLIGRLLSRGAGWIQWAFIAAAVGLIA